MDGSERTKLGRRALLAAGAAGVAAAAAQAVAPAGVRAGEDGDVVFGEVNVGRNTTELAITGTHALSVRSDVGDGLRGETNAAVKSGVYGYTNHPNGYGVYGDNHPSGAYGILGSKDQGVKGAADTGEGVRGESTKNQGVVGVTHAGGFKAGVEGQALHVNGWGVRGINVPEGTKGELGYGGFGVLATAPNDVNHWALFVQGRAGFHTSGIVTVPQDRNYVSVAMPALTNWSMVLATLQTNRGGISIQAAVAKPTLGKITIYLNKKAPVDLKVAYLVLQTE
jgi:hypothetical protein